jgi:hypothetical protein
MSIVLISLLGYSQATNVGELRIANATTAFGVNFPIGTKIYNVDTKEYWVATAGVVSTATLTTASASFTLLNNSGADDQTASEVSVTASGNLASENVQDALEELQGDIDGISDTDDQTASEVDITDTDGNYSSGNVEGALSEIGDSIAAYRADIDQNVSDISTNASAIAGITSNVATNLSLGTVTATTMDVNSSDGTNATLIAANTDDAGLLTAAKFDEITANTAKETNVSTDLSLGTVSATTVDVNSSDGSNATITAATNSAAGVATAAQITKLEGIATGAEVNLDLITEKFEEDDGTATAHVLSETAVVAQGCRVSLNGATLDPAKYTFASGSITIGVPVYQYD